MHKKTLSSEKHKKQQKYGFCYSGQITGKVAIIYSALSKRWDTRRFQSPGMAYAPVHFWVWNGKCSHEETDRQLDEMYRLGVRAFYIVPEPKDFRPNSMPTDLEPDYLTDDYFEEYLYAVRQAKRRGMRCWLYDEGGWPSGGACGKVLNLHPETVQKSVRSHRLTFLTGEAYQKRHPEALAAFTDGAEYIEEGFVFSGDTGVTEYYSASETALSYPDITKPGTTDCFLDITHNAYKKAMGDEFESLFSAVFTDEPKAPYIAPDNFAVYERVYGRSILPYLPILVPNLDPSLADKILKTDGAAEALSDWYDLSSRLFCDNFLMPCKKWANDHGMLFTGHMDVDHIPEGCVHGGLNYHLMRALRCLDIPGVDVIWRQIFPGKKRKAGSGEVIAENGFFPRYASSAAAQNGSDYAMTECLGVYGNGVTFSEMRYCFGFQAIRGINVFNPALISYSREGYVLTQEQPFFIEKFACYKYLNEFNTYLERLSYVCSLGDRVCNTALYYPINDFWRRENENAVSASFEALGRALEDRRIDFDVVDDDVLNAAAGIGQGNIRMGKARYTHIVIPLSAHIPNNTKAVLERFVAAGGTVCYSADELSGFEIAGDAEEVRMMRRILENGELYCFFNENDKTADFRFPISGEYAYRVSLEEGELYACSLTDGKVGLTIVPGETTAVLITNEPLMAKEPLPDYENVLPLREFTVSKKTACVLKNTGCETVDCAYVPQTAPLGDWALVAGKDYSGSCVYKTTFALESEPAEDIVLDLGNVCYACEIALNGTVTKTEIMPPYRCVLPKELLKKTNELEITVTNTMANQFVYSDAFKDLEPWQFSQYYEKEIEFMKDSLKSGLFGPVCLFWNGNTRQG